MALFPPLDDFDLTCLAVRDRLDQAVPLEVSYDRESDILTVNGMRYSGAVFRAYALCPVGTAVQFIERADGCITLRKIVPGQPL